jgi:hypothetical protein
MTYLLQMSYVGQGANIILEVNCIEISTQNYVVIRGHLQKLGLAPRSGTSIFVADFVSDLPRDITS